MEYISALNCRKGMGIYVYTLRKKTLPIVLEAGETVHANLYSYAYRYCSSYEEDIRYIPKDLRRDARTYLMLAARMENAARRAFREPRSDYAILGDLDDKNGPSDLPIFKGVIDPVWSDCFKLPFREPIGFVSKVGKKLFQSSHTKWYPLDPGNGQNVMHRSVVIDGKLEKERLVIP